MGGANVQSREHGWSLVELLTALGIVGIVVALALPATRDWQEVERLRSAAVLVHNDLRLAQAEAHKRQVGITVRFRRTAPGHWCYGWSIARSCDCFQPADCTVDGESRTVFSADWPGIDAIPNVAGDTFGINPVRGTITAGNLTLVSPSGYAVRVVVHGMGRVRSCIPSGHPPLAGMAAC